MKKQKSEILIINQYYPPDTSATASIIHTVAEALSRKFNVHVIAGRPSYNPKVFHPWYLFRTTLQKTITVTRVGSSAMSRHFMLKRLLNYFSYLILIIPQVVISKPAAIICMTDPPIAGLIGAFFAKRKKCPFIYYIQDLHPDMAISSGMVKSCSLLYLWESLHRWILKKSNLIIVLDQDMRRKIISKGLHPKKITVIRHGAPLNMNPDSRELNLVKKISKDFDFTIIHAGNLGFYGAWETLIKAAKILEPDNIGFIFIGEGAYKKGIEQMASNCSNVRFLPFQPEEDIPHVLKSGDIHLITIQAGIEGSVSPSKLYRILAAGRPVLGVVHRKSDLATMITRSKCGVVSDPEDPGAVAETVRMLSKNPGQLVKMGRQASMLSIEYDSVKLFKRFVQIVEKTINTRSYRIWRKIKVFRIISRLNIGGPSIYLKFLHEGLNPELFESRLYVGKTSVREGDMAYLFETSDSKPESVPCLQREINIGKDLMVIFFLTRKLFNEKPDIVDTHMSKAGLCGRIAVIIYNLLHAKKIKTVHTFHGHVFDGYFSKSKSFVFIYLERMIAKYTDIIISLSKTQKREFAEEYRIAPAKKIKTIELGFNLKPFLESRLLRGKFRRKLKIDDTTILVGIVGRLVSIKKHKMFFEAVKIFIQQNPDLPVVIVIVGDGELREDLETYCQSHGLSDHVKFCGWIKDIESVYADLDVLALTSINEGTPVSIIEAMASSVPVIATDAGGVVDMIGPAMEKTSDNGFKICERGVFCRKNDAIGFSKGLKWLIDNKTSAKGEMVNSARAFVKERYAYKRLVADMEKLYTELVQ